MVKPQQPGGFVVFYISSLAVAINFEKLLAMEDVA